ncbi:hypothetical protein Droror1_Dr00025690 [Drosera rotundifolia]
MVEREKQSIGKFVHEGCDVNMVDTDDEKQVEDEDEEMISLRDPLVSQTKGHKKDTCMKNPIEETSGCKKLRKCALCKTYTDHDRRNHYKVLGLEEPAGLDEDE